MASKLEGLPTEAVLDAAREHYAAVQQAAYDALGDQRGAVVGDLRRVLEGVGC